jgi:uncharacterized LabA/DUF88 family protein
MQQLSALIVLEARTYGMNSIDIAIIIDAMNLLYSGTFDGFCLVSSDSDFTRLNIRIRKSGLSVYGFGNRTTLGPFVIACGRSSTSKTSLS